MFGFADGSDLVARLKDPETVEEVHIESGARMTQAAWGGLAACTHVRAVSLVGKPTPGGLGLMVLRAEVVRFLSRLKGLEELVVKSVRGDLRNLLHRLSRPQNLRYLMIVGAVPCVEGVDLSRLNLAGLTRIRLEAMTVDYTVVRSLRDLPHVREVDLSGGTLRPGALDGVRRHHTLESLWIAYGQSVLGRDDIEALATCDRLTQLDFPGTAIAPSAILALGQCRPLRFLPLGRMKLSRPVADFLATHLVALEQLGIQDAKIEKGAWNPLVRFKSLTGISVGSMDSVSWSALARIASLRTVDVYGDKDAKAMAQFKKTRPDVSILIVGGAGGYATIFV